MSSGFCLLLVLTLQAQSAEGAYARGAKYFQEGELNLAEREFLRAIQLRPDFAEAYHSLGVLYLRQKVYPRAEELLIKSVSLKVDSPLVYLDLGTAYLNQGKLEQARTTFESLLRLPPSNSSLLFAVNFNLALVLRAQRDAKTALIHLQKADALLPNQPEVLLTLFELSVEQGLSSEAGKALGRLVERAWGRPDLQRYVCLSLLDGTYSSAFVQTLESTLRGPAPRVEALLVLGSLFLSSGQLQKATETLKEALELDSSSSLGLFLLGRAYNRLNDRRAVQTLVSAVALDPADERLWKELSDAFSNHQAHDEAISTFKRYVQLFPQNAFVHVLLGEAYFGGSLVWKAIAELEQALKLDPDLFSANYALGFVHKYVGNHTQAKTFLKHALSLDPADALAHMELGEILVHEGDYEGATAYLKKAVGSSTVAAAAHSRLGQVYFLQKKYAQSEIELKRSIELDREDPQSHYLLAQVYFASGKRELAKSEYALFQNLEKIERHSRKLRTGAHSKD